MIGSRLYRLILRRSTVRNGVGAEAGSWIFGYQAKKSIKSIPSSSVVFLLACFCCSSHRNTVEYDVQAMLLP